LTCLLDSPAKALANQGGSKVVELLDIALVPQKNGMMFDLGRDHAVYAELLKRKGDLAQAKENLNKAIEIFRECGVDWW